MGRSKAPKIELRRLRVAELLMARPSISISQIARELGCSRNTAFKDVHAIRKEWADRRTELYESKAAEDFERTTKMIEVLWPQVLAGNLWAFDRCTSLLTYRSKVLGLETQRQELDVGEVLAGYLARLAEGNDAPAPGPGR